MKSFEYTSPGQIKTAGLKSNQFTREVFRFEAPPSAAKAGNRQNQSTISFGQDCQAPNRFSRVPMDVLESQRMEAKKERIDARLKIRRFAIVLMIESGGVILNLTDGRSSIRKELQI